MDARAKIVREILHSGDQYLIPFFQRSYSWKRKNWSRLRDDVFRLAEDGVKSQHFLGPLVCTPAQSIPGETPSFQLIDGQQRLTTLTLLLAGIRDIASDNGLNELAEEVHEDYLVHKRKKGLDKYKVVPRIGDREALIAILESKVQKEHKKLGVHRAWRFFKAEIADWAGTEVESRLAELFRAVTASLSLVVITIDGENPYEIFESLNSTGLPLEESDLIRNFLFMQVPIADQDDFHHDHWKSLEALFDETDTDESIPQTQFYRSYLMRNGEYSKSKMTFVDFKQQNRSRSLSPEAQVLELLQYARFEQMLRRPGICEDPEIEKRLRSIAALDVTTAHPLIMHLLGLWEAETIDAGECATCLDDITSFVLRRSICSESTRTYGRWFVEAIEAIKDQPSDNLRGYLLFRGWPDDVSFRERLSSFSLYRREPRKCRLILLTLEASLGHKEKVDPSNLTIEHVLPQSISRGKSGRAWQDMLGEGWKEDHERHLHTLGNLTLTGYNQDLSNSPYPVKKEELNSAKSKIGLNAYFDDVATWDAKAIKVRGEKLATEATALWPRPAGGTYEPPASSFATQLSADERRQRYAEFWAGLLDHLDEEGFSCPRPEVPTRANIAFSIGISGFRLLALMNLKKQYVAVSFSCRGKLRRQNFNTLLESKGEIEAEIGSTLSWQADAKMSVGQILIRLDDVAPLDDSKRHVIYEWLAENLEAFRATFTPRCESLGTALASRHERRRAFWRQLLIAASEKTDLHGRISPRTDNWLGASAGVSGLSYNYVVRMNDASVEFWFDKRTKEANKKLFDEFMASRDEIEVSFGQSLNWERLDSGKASKVTHEMEIGGLSSSEENWPTIHEQMVASMVQLEAAMSPHVAKLSTRKRGS